jgi:hypothetical protein
MSGGNKKRAVCLSYLYVNVLARHSVFALVEGLVVLRGIDEEDLGGRDVQV